MLELAGLVILGILSQWIAWRTRVPAILPLILIGLLFGPISTLFSEDGGKWIEPVFDVATGTGLFPGESLFYFVSLSIGIILFEGGLTLKRKEVSGVGQTIIRLITVGSLITFVIGAIGAHFIMGLNWPVAFLFAGLIIVTGPTVIAPILRNLPINRNVATVLKWEGILIDPIGALVAVLVYDFIITGSNGQHFTMVALTSFLKIVIVGCSLGFTAAHLLRFMIKRKLIPHYLLNVFTLALVLAIFVFSDQLEHESGLLSVVVMGMILGNMNVSELDNILDFKESLSVLLISILFILLSANIDMEHIFLLLDWNVLFLFLFVILILRPLSVYVSTLGSTLSFNEKAFISWVGPRGIVAAGIASLFGLKLIGKTEDAEYIAPLVFMIVAGTVLLNATTARSVARLLGVTLKNSNGILIVGANKAAQLIGAYLQKAGRHVVLIDRAESLINMAKKEGLTAIQGDIYAEDLTDNFELLDMGYLMAMTASSEVNRYAVERFRQTFGENGSFRLITQEELLAPKEEAPKEGLFSCTDDFINLSEVVRDYPEIHEVAVQSQGHFLELIERISKRGGAIPMFIRTQEEDELKIIPSQCDSIKVAEGDRIIYVGKRVETENVAVVEKE